MVTPSSFCNYVGALLQTSSLGDRPGFRHTTQEALITTSFAKAISRWSIEYFHAAVIFSVKSLLPRERCRSRKWWDTILYAARDRHSYTPPSTYHRVHGGLVNRAVGVHHQYAGDLPHRYDLDGSFSYPLQPSPLQEFIG